MSYISVYGQPGGLWFGVTLNLDAFQYEVHNEGGDVVFADPREALCQEWAMEAALDAVPDDEQVYLAEVTELREHILGSDNPDEPNFGRR